MSESIKYSLLFVDDESNILSSLNRLFRPEGFNVYLASSGQEGLDILQKENIDVIVSDMRMPEMDGAQFLEQAYKKWPKTVRLLLTGYSDVNETVSAINKGKIFQYINKPWDDSEIVFTVKTAIDYKQLQDERDSLLVLSKQQNGQLKELNKNLDNKVNIRTKELHQAMEKLVEANDTLKKHYISTLNIFTNLIEMRLGTAPGYYRRVADLARNLSIDAHIDKNGVQNITFAALLMDIGKVGFTDELLNTPYEDISLIEQKQYEKHPVIGEATLTVLEPFAEAARIIRNYTENYNGTGYPDKLKSKQIPIGSRIIALASDYEALITGTSVKRKLTPKEAMEYISRYRGKKYDGSLIDILFPQISKRESQAKNKILIAGTGELKIGMVLMKELILSNGMLLLEKGQKLDDRIIKKMRAIENSMGEKFKIHVSET